MKYDMRIRGKLYSARGFSVIEIICMSGISVIAAAALLLMLLFYRESARRSNDNLLEDTARHVAVLNLAENGCIVEDCPGGERCIHRSEGVLVGYLENPVNRIVEALPFGYNQSSVMKVDGTTYRGDRGTMVLRVECEGDRIRLSWVKGR